MGLEEVDVKVESKFGPEEVDVKVESSFDFDNRLLLFGLEEVDAKVESKAKVKVDVKVESKGFVLCLEEWEDVEANGFGFEFGLEFAVDGFLRRGLGEAEGVMINDGGRWRPDEVGENERWR